MKLHVAITDSEWSHLLGSERGIGEVNFWQPGGKTVFRALNPGELFLFKPHKVDYIIGGGVFAYSTLLPVRLAWEAFERGNGVMSLEEMRRRIEKYRRQPALPQEDYTIGCIILTQPFFLPNTLWIPLPGWAKSIVQGKGYNLTTEPGISLYRAVLERLLGAEILTEEIVHQDDNQLRFGTPTLIHPRLGQGAFRILVTDAYARRCAISGEKVLPVLQAAHVRPYSEGGLHQVDNGLLLRSDLHTLFDRGYITVTTDYHVEISRRLREDYENGREYYAFHGSSLRKPERGMPLPTPDNLMWHNQRFMG